MTNTTSPGHQSQDSAHRTQDPLAGLVDVPALARFLDGHLGGGPLPIDVRRHTAGYSNITFMIDRGEQRLVMRRPPSGNLLPSAHDVLREHRFLSATHGQARVPRPLVACDDTSVIGAPFYVMERVAGTEIRETIPAAYDHPEGRRQMAEDMIAALVEVHAVDWRAGGLTAPPGSYVDRQLHRWQRQWDLTKVRTREQPGLDRISDWLDSHKPAETETTIAHGDYKIDNIIYAFEKPEVRAILDWELATLGDPISDLGWMISGWGDRENPPPPPGPNDRALPTTLREGFPLPREIEAMYAEKSGRSTEHVRFYVLLALFKGAVIGEGIYMRHLEGNAANPLAAQMEFSVPRQINRMLSMI